MDPASEIGHPRLLTHGDGPTPIHVAPVISDLHIHARIVSPSMHAARIQSHLSSPTRVIARAHLNGVVAAEERVRTVHANTELALTALEGDAKGRPVASERLTGNLVLLVHEEAGGDEV